VNTEAMRNLTHCNSVGTCRETKSANVRVAKQKTEE
jgi:hypothetical protein